MSLPYANYEAVDLSVTPNVYPFDSSNYRTASTVHQVLCLTNGSITIYPMAGCSFTWTAKAGDTLDVLCSGVTISTGTYIGFRSKFERNPFYGKGNQI